MNRRKQGNKKRKGQQKNKMKRNGKTMENMEKGQEVVFLVRSAASF
jgi:preprotein translocase subunit YajC